MEIGAWERKLLTDCTAEERLLKEGADHHPRIKALATGGYIRLEPEFCGPLATPTGQLFAQITDAVRAVLAEGLMSTWSATQMERMTDSAHLYVWREESGKWSARLICTAGQKNGWLRQERVNAFDTPGDAMDWADDTDRTAT